VDQHEINVQGLFDLFVVMTRKPFIAIRMAVVVKVKNDDLEEVMEKYEEESLAVGFPLPGASSADLRGRQSVRATFKLSAKTISAITIVATHLGIKQKSLFDHLAEDIKSLSSIARAINYSVLQSKDRIQKTYVISRRSLSFLDKISKDFDAPRDALVEYSIQRLMPLISSEKEKHEKRKIIFGELLHHLKEGKKILRKSIHLLGQEDPVVEQVAEAMTVCGNTCRNIESFIERGKIIEEFFP
jgi:hypothetical protein|tara:strand:+ start:43663 stop:44391 length:729 start_codon:yes stop_codon:yes gene_type:complete